MSAGPSFADTFLDARVLAAALPSVASGAVVTVALSVVVIAAGFGAGFGLALLRLAGGRAVTVSIIVAVDLLRSVPPLVLVVLLYFGLPSAGVTLSGFSATALTLASVLAAFSEEILYASVRAVPRAQTEAARSLGLSRRTAFRRVVLPQALRIAAPPLTNRTMAIVKSTSLGSVVGLADILGAAQSELSFSASPAPLLLAASAYVALFVPLVALARHIERRLGTA